MKYFCYDPECGFETFNNEAEAKACAEEYLNAAREEAGDGWAESVDQICYGKIIGSVVQTKYCDAPKTEEERINFEEKYGICFNHDWDSYADYELIKEKQWVKCSDRMPDCENVYFFTPNKHVVAGYFLKEEKPWVFDRRGDEDGWPKNAIKYWMPRDIPNPPIDAEENK